MRSSNGNSSKAVIPIVCAILTLFLIGAITFGQKFILITKHYAEAEKFIHGTAYPLADYIALYHEQEKNYPPSLDRLMAFYEQHKQKEIGYLDATEIIQTKHSISNEQFKLVFHINEYYDVRISIDSNKNLSICLFDAKTQ